MALIFRNSQRSQTGPRLTCSATLQATTSRPNQRSNVTSSPREAQEVQDEQWTFAPHNPPPMQIVTNSRGELQLMEEASTHGSSNLVDQGRRNQSLPVDNRNVQVNNLLRRTSSEQRRGIVNSNDALEQHSGQSNLTQFTADFSIYMAEYTTLTNEEARDFVERCNQAQANGRKLPLRLFHEFVNCCNFIPSNQLPQGDLWAERVPKLLRAKGVELVASFFTVEQTFEIPMVVEMHTKLHKYMKKMAQNFEKFGNY